jgi:hypothetical protein
MHSEHVPGVEYVFATQSLLGATSLDPVSSGGKLSRPAPLATMGHWEGKAMRAFAVVIGLLLVIGAAHSETDVFMRAVGFALTGSDDAEAKAIDRANCVFANKNDVFHLNNVHTDRIKIQGWENKLGDKWINVDLHGDDVVVEQTIEPMTDTFANLFGPQWRQTHPEAFVSHRESHKEFKLRLTTGDVDRVTRAWQYIYSHGCTGKQSPF